LKSELINAVEQGDVDSVNRMLAASPELVGARTEQGVSLILHALYHRQLPTADLLAERRGAGVDLHEAAALGDRERVEEHLQTSSGAMSSNSADGFTPLHYAAFFGHPEVVQLLIDSGADVDAEAGNASRVRPLHSAAACEDVESCKRLLAAGTDPNRQQHGGFTALMSAAMHGSQQLVHLLLDSGARRAIESDDGRTAADFAREKGHEELLDALVDALDREE